MLTFYTENDSNIDWTLRSSRKKLSQVQVFIQNQDTLVCKYYSFWSTPNLKCYSSSYVS